MQIEIRSRPSFANMLVRLAQGDRIVAESDAMASMSSSITLRTRWNGGFFGALLRRFLGGESLFVNEFSTNTGGELVLTQPWPGDITCVELKGSSLFLQPGAFVACDPDVQLGVGYAGLRSFIAREGLFRLRVSGQGRVWFGAYGGIVEKDIEGSYIVDSSHLVAYEPSVRMRIGFAGSLLSSLLSQEGLVMRLTGPGRIYLQTRSMEGLASWVNSQL
jgi:uncharacterized protein (TIGR00266 family)